MPPLSKSLPPAVENLAEGLIRALDETGWSARGLAAAAGLGPDAIRNVTRSISTTLRGDRLDRIAAILGIHPDALTGERPWPRRRLRKAPVIEPPPRTRRTGSLRLPEVDLRPGVPGAGPDILGRTPTTTWTVPVDLIVDRNLRAEDLVIVRAPTPLPGRGIQVGDRLLVDVGEPARRSGRPGVVVTWTGAGHELVRSRGRRGGLLRLEGVGGVAEVSVGGAGVVGRVVGRWGWM